MDFDLSSRSGSVVTNLSIVGRRDLHAAIPSIKRVFEAGYAMGKLVTLLAPGERVGNVTIPEDRIGLGTVCSITLNGVLLAHGIPVYSSFGGLLEIRDHKPIRFVEMVHYSGTTLDPLEIFIRGHMTSAAEAAKTGFGMLGASFREVPAVALPEVQRLAALSEKKGIGGVLAIGSPNQPLLDIPVAHGRAGLVVCGGLNPVAAVVEAGIEVTSTAMSTLCDFDQLIDYTELELVASKNGF